MGNPLDGKGLKVKGKDTFFNSGSWYQWKPTVHTFYTPPSIIAPFYECSDQRKVETDVLSHRVLDRGSFALKAAL